MDFFYNTLKEIGVSDKPIITVYNKLDLYRQRYFDEYLPEEVQEQLMVELQENRRNQTPGVSVFISATERLNIEQFREKLLETIKEQYDTRYPYLPEQY